MLLLLLLSHHERRRSSTAKGLERNALRGDMAVLCMCGGVQIHVRVDVGVMDLLIVSVMLELLGGCSGFGSRASRPRSFPV